MIKKEPQAVLDDVDHQILGLLAANARLSHRAISREIRMSPGAVSERVDRLEGCGVIRGYHADVDPKLLGLRTEVFIGLQTEQGHPVDSTMQALYEVSVVRSVSLVTGNWDFVIEMQVRDQDHLRQVLIEEIWTLPLFRHSETLVILQREQRHDSWFMANTAEH